MGYPFILGFLFGFLAIFWVDFGYLALSFGLLTFGALGWMLKSLDGHGFVKV